MLVTGLSQKQASEGRVYLSSQFKALVPSWQAGMAPGALGISLGASDASAVRKQGVMDAGTQLTPPGPQPWDGAFHIQRSRPTSGDVIRKLPSKHTLMLIFPAILDPVKLTVDINLHRCSVKCLAGKHKDRNEMPGIRVQILTLGRQRQEDAWDSMVSY